jgi:cyanophycinase-like exopeptidase
MAAILKLVFRNIGVASPTIAYVGSASDDNPGFFQRISGMFKSAGKAKFVLAPTIDEKADIKKTIKTIESADAVFVSGGDVEAGMQVLERRGIAGIFADLYRQGKFFFGVSAGSIMLADKWVRWRDPDDDSTAELFDCLGVAPVICDTHGEGEGWEELRAAITISPEGTMGYGITSNSCLLVQPDGKVEALAGPVARYLSRGKKAVKQPDLVPAVEI